MIGALKMDVVSVLSLIFRYGGNLKLLREDAANELLLLMKHIKIFLSTQRVKTASELSILHTVHFCSYEELSDFDCRDDHSSRR